jgi:hypothetical protein
MHLEAFSSRSEPNISIWVEESALLAWLGNGGISGINALGGCCYPQLLQGAKTCGVRIGPPAAEERNVKTGKNPLHVF